MTLEKRVAQLVRSPRRLLRRLRIQAAATADPPLSESERQVLLPEPAQPSEG